jgi:ribosomal RNA-processing protein 8
MARNKGKQKAKQTGKTNRKANPINKQKGKQKKAEKVTKEQKTKTAVSQVVKTGAMSTLQEQMRQKLDGAQFRWINEQLYTSTG